MKKILFALSVGFISMAALGNDVHAQNAAGPVAFNNNQHFKSVIRNMAALESPAFMGTYVADIRDVNTRAVKDFHGRFNHASNTLWFSDRNGFSSYFVQDGYGDRAYYDKKGRWQYSLIFYGEDRLPKDIRNVVRSKYFDMSITLVEEVQVADAMVYVIHLEDKSNIKIIKINKDGDMETMQDLSKAN
jgi:hypothetical protein